MYFIYIQIYENLGWNWHSQWNVVGDSLGLYEVFRLVLGNYMPAYSVIDTILQQHCPVHSISLVQSYVATVCLCHTANLQHKHDFTVRRQKGRNSQLESKITQVDIYYSIFCGWSK